MDNNNSNNEDFLTTSYKRIRAAITSSNPPTTTITTLPTAPQLTQARASLPHPESPTYLQPRGAQQTLEHLVNDLAPALNGQNRSSRYWGFVTGGALPVAEAADNLVSAFDQNVQVHLPGQTVATDVEDAALRMLIGVLGLGEMGDWAGRTFTTGATASNVLGLACGREAVVQARFPEGSDGVGELGVLGACFKAGVKEVQVLTSMGHSSLAKAASIVGLGRSAVKELPYSDNEPWRLNLDLVEKELQRDGVASIIAVSAGEVNTGRFATTGIEDMKRLRNLADRHGAWIHVDGGLELADSITVDGHKLLNVPYDNGIFFTRKVAVLTNVCKNPNAAYLSSGGESEIQSPLNVGLENSRRFRALPAYAVLLSEGRDGIAEMLARMVRVARGIAEVIRELPDYILLPDEQAGIEDTHICVLFRAKDEALNNVLVETINQGKEWYVSGTKWKGQTAVRVAVANWRVQETVDVNVFKSSLLAIARQFRDSGGS